MGAKILAGLPEKTSLTADFMEAFGEDAPRALVAVVVLQPKKKAVDLENDEAEETVTFRIAALEHMDGAEGQTLLEQLRKRHADRTGEHMLPGFDKAATDDVPGSSTGDPAEVTRQLGLLRKEEATARREKADLLGPGEERDELESEADSFEAGNRDEELRARIPQALFSEAEGDAA